MNIFGFGLELRGILFGVSLAKTVEELRVSDVALKASEELRTTLANKLGRFKPLLERNLEALNGVKKLWYSVTIGKPWLSSDDEELDKIHGILH